MENTPEIQQIDEDTRRKQIERERMEDDEERQALVEDLKGKTQRTDAATLRHLNRRAEEIKQREYLHPKWWQQSQ